MARNGKEMTTVPNLTSRQRKAITALLTCSSVPLAAKQSGVSERTIHRYLADDDFKEALTDAEEEAINQATRRLLSLQDSAMTTLESILNDAEQKPSLRLRAANSILGHLVKLRGLRRGQEKVVQRIVEKELDKALDLLEKKLSREAFYQIVSILTNEDGS